MEIILKIIKWVACGYGVIMTVFGLPMLLSVYLEEKYFWPSFWEELMMIILIMLTFVSVLVFLEEIYKDGIKKGKDKNVFYK